MKNIETMTVIPSDIFLHKFSVVVSLLVVESFRVHEIYAADHPAVCSLVVSSLLFELLLSLDLQC